MIGRVRERNQVRERNLERRVDFRKLREIVGMWICLDQVLMLFDGVYM